MFRQMSKPDFDKAKLFLQNKIEDVGHPLTKGQLISYQI